MFNRLPHGESRRRGLRPEKSRFCNQRRTKNRTNSQDPKYIGISHTEDISKADILISAGNRESNKIKNARAKGIKINDC